MIKGQQYKLISDICLNINKNLSKRKNEIDERLSNNLEDKLKKSGTKEKYIESIKYNVMFYKISIRNIEFLLDKFIKNGDISNKDKLENELKKATLSCKQYINKAIQSKGETFNKVDLKIFLSYADIEDSDLINKLENEYKILSIYNDVLNIFIRNLAHMNKDDISLLDSDDSIKFIKVEIRKTVNSIVKVSTINKNKESNEINNDESKSNIEVSQVQEKESVKEPITKEDIAKEEEVIEEFEEEVCKEKNELEISYLNALNSLENDKLLSKMDKEYKILCVLEEIDYSKAYGFGEGGIKEYIASIVLLDLVDERYKDLIKGGIRLLINGEFGAVNFAEYIKYLVINEVGIDVEIWNEGNEIISDKFTDAINHNLVRKPIKEYINGVDIDEYVFMIENADKSSKFRTDDNSYLDDSYNDELNEDTNNQINNEEIVESKGIDEKEVYDEELDNTSKKKPIKIIAGLVVIFIIGISGVSIAVSKKKPETKQQEAPPIVKEEDSLQETYSDADYVIEDSNTRYLTEEDLSNYTKAELGLIRNEIFARYGYVFTTEPYKTYFSSKNWYKPDESVEANTELLNEVEKANIELIQSMESGSNTTESEKNIEPISYDYVTTYEEIYYNVYTEAYTVESEARNHINKLLDKGILSSIVEEDGYYKVKVGSSTTLDGANEISSIIKEKSFDTYILAYDSYIEADLLALREEGLHGDFEVFQYMYYELEYEIKDRLAYERYMKQLEAIYDLVTEGA